MVKSWSTSCRPPPALHRAGLLRVGAAVQHDSALSPESRQHLKGLLIPWLQFFCFILFSCVCVQAHTLPGILKCGHYDISMCLCVHCDAEPTPLKSQPSPWRLRIVCGERGAGPCLLYELRSSCQQFSQCVPPPPAPIILHLQLPPFVGSLWSRPSTGTTPILHVQSCANSTVLNSRGQCNHLRGLHVAARDVQRAVCHEHEDASRSWQRECFIVFRSLPLIVEEVQ